MLFNEKTVLLKDGTQALFRSPRIEDAEALLDYLRATSEETEFVLRYPEECTLTLDQETRFIQSIIDSPSSVMILCEIDGRIAGNCQLSIGSRIKVCHRGAIAVALYKEFWGRGIGTAMLAELIELGRQFGLMQLELEFVEGNERGRALYEKMSFEIVAARPDAYRFKDGSLHKEYIMVRKL